MKPDLTELDALYAEAVAPKTHYVTMATRVSEVFNAYPFLALRIRELEAENVELRTQLNQQEKP